MTRYCNPITAPKASYKDQMLVRLWDVFHRLDDDMTPLSAKPELLTVDGWRAEREVWNAADDLMRALRNLEDAREIEAEELEAEREDHPYLSMQQLGITPGRTRP